MNAVESRTEIGTRRPRGRRVLAAAGWMAAGFALATLAFVAARAWLPGGIGTGAAATGRPAEIATAANAEDATLWTCGMHPQVIEEEPGLCPICHMDLVPMDPGLGGHRHSGEREVLFYRHPMNPEVTSPVPAEDEMGMAYVPVYAEEAAGAEGVVVIDPAVVQNMNVATAPVERRDLVREIRTVGYLDYDQGKMVTVTTKYPGWIEKVFVNYVGQPVRRGAPLFTIYSPELVQTQQELISALDYARRLEGTSPTAHQHAQALVEAARTRLGYWDIGRGQIAAVEASGEPLRALTVTSPAGGLVMMRRPGLEGMAVNPGMELFHIADLSSLWLGVEVFEDQLPWLSEGAEATVTLSYFPGETFVGRVRFVEPQVSETTRTVGLRLEVPNPQGRLRAGMYATVVFDPVVAADAVAVPPEAVLRTGRRNLVVTALGQGRFAPREIELGVETEDWVAVTSGLEPGERVVTSAQFLIDSESNLRAAIQKLVAARGSGDAP